MNALAELTRIEEITGTICELENTASNFETADDEGGKFIFFEVDVPESYSNEEILEILAEINAQIREINPDLSCIMTVKSSR